MRSKADKDTLLDGLVSEGYLRSQIVIDAMRRVPREAYIPDDIKGRAYYDCPQPIGYGQTISAPHMVAIMTEHLDVKPDSHILEIGTGSGYQAAVLAELAGEGDVISVERVPQLAEWARIVLKRLGYDNVHVVVGDGTLGYSEDAPYDRIIVTAAAPHVPAKLVGQLRAGGRLLVPVGGRWSQRLIVVSKDEAGRLQETDHGGCVFVPLIGEDGW